MTLKNTLPNPIYAWFVVITLSGAMAFSLVDRFALSLLFEPIKADLLLTDTQLGMLHGIAFGLFYATMGIPIAWLIDRWSRKWVIFWGIGCWSIMTMLCGLSSNYLQLLAARVGVGVGEASLAPAGYSIIADIVPEKRLATAISVFQMGSLFGGGLAFLAGGGILRFIEGSDLGSVPLLAELAPWQITFILVALPGIIFLALILIIREPVRLGLAQKKDDSSPGLIQALTNKRSLYFNLFFGNACLIAISYANLTWIPSVLVRQYNWGLPDIGFRFGLVMLIVAPAGVLLGGLLADRWESLGKKDAYPKVLNLAAILSTLLVIISFFAESAWTLFAIVGMIQFTTSISVGTGPAAIIRIAPANVRARISAVYVFMINIIGLGVGPIVIGLFSDHLFHTSDGILSSLSIFSILMCVISVMSLRAFHRNLMRN